MTMVEFLDKIDTMIQDSWSDDGISNEEYGEMLEKLEDVKSMMVGFDDPTV